MKTPDAPKAAQTKPQPRGRAVALWAVGKEQYVVGVLELAGDPEAPDITDASVVDSRPVSVAAAFSLFTTTVARKLRENASELWVHFLPR